MLYVNFYIDTWAECENRYYAFDEDAYGDKELDELLNQFIDEFCDEHGITQDDIDDSCWRCMTKHEWIQHGGVIW